MEARFFKRCTYTCACPNFATIILTNLFKLEVSYVRISAHNFTPTGSNLGDNFTSDFPNLPFLPLSLSPFPQSPPLVLREMTLETLPPKDGERRKIKRDHSAARNSSYCREPSKFRSREGVKGKSRESTDGLFDLGVNFCLVGTFASSSLSAEGKIARTAGIRVRELQ